MESQNKMPYRYLGNTGLQVSAISLGFADATDQQTLNQIIKRAFELGINCFDCAEGYGDDGSVETLLGNALKALNVGRDEYVISTKIFFGKGVYKSAKPNQRGLSRKHLIEGTKASLKRLQLEYVDVLSAHRYDPNTPMEEIVRGFDYLVNNGYAFYWGTSEWSADKIQEAFTICEKYNLVKPVTEQPEYSMLVRERFEKEYANLFRDYKYGSTIWSPLAGGILTGKYNKEIPKDSRGGHPLLSYSLIDKLSPESIGETRRITIALEKIAQELGTSSAGLALAWTLKNADVSTAIIGASKLTYLEDNVAKTLVALDKLTPEVEQRIEEILKNKPVLTDGGRLEKSGKSRR